MPLPFDDTALRNSIKHQLEHWVDNYGSVPIVGLLQEVIDSRATFVAWTSAGSSAGFSTASTRLGLYITNVTVGPTAF